ncbi:lipopolysaccharide transport periplasmic protein LptA [Algicola sagamiensis]|uniref:lipopolysaccharide transport periplasmic protein LptA n=1 Tax=Algicola sagamiensis TaxID=163869 RepID=UPI00037CDD77|nr:lipopolysaccharide transport periplasmic protein LptA [Algicola sagamiensis]
MLKQFISQTALRRLLLSLILTTSGYSTIVHAEFTDDIKINSSKQFMDIKNNTLVFQDNVVVLLGSMQINADVMRIKKTKDGRNEVIVAKGNPAKYKQTLEDGKEVIAAAQEIYYMVSKKTIVLKKNAYLQQSGSHVKSEQITYNLETQLLSAEGSENKTGRVTTIISTNQNKPNVVETKPENQAPAQTDEQDEPTP